LEGARRQGSRGWAGRQGRARRAPMRTGGGRPGARAAAAAASSALRCWSDNAGIRRQPSHSARPERSGCSAGACAGGGEGERRGRWSSLTECPLNARLETGVGLSFFLSSDEGRGDEDRSLAVAPARIAPLLHASGRAHDVRFVGMLTCSSRERTDSISRCSRARTSASEAARLPGLPPRRAPPNPPSPPRPAACRPPGKLAARQPAASSAPSRSFHQPRCEGRQHVVGPGLRSRQNLRALQATTRGAVPALPPGRRRPLPRGPPQRPSGQPLPRPQTPVE
jgi:hypothetical protein